ncbi:hypothetical protein F751_1098 [Auxenochlorella protothecoides]|nr:hypothetical protein F751_1098 [Auxenochlorella protothecoides]KFM23402.1 hypothetical protein F751_1098 [Auxenochlorella protothecoides]
MRQSAAVSALYGAVWNTPTDAYLTLGLAHCFEKTDDGKLVDRYIIEPLSANSLECMANGGKTCYKHVFSTTLEQAQSRDKAALPAEFAEARFCEEYETRCDSAARTWLRPHALDNLLGIVPLGQVKSNFQYSVVDKRVLNFENVVDDDDNIKQDLSIDVYGRKAADEAAAALAADGASPVAGGAAEVAEEEEDDIDALLA